MKVFVPDEVSVNFIVDVPADIVAEVEEIVAEDPAIVRVPLHMVNVQMVFAEHVKFNTV